MDSSPRILLIHEVAILLRVAVSTIYRWLAESRNGRGHFPLPISDRGKRLRWLASDIEAFLQSQSQIVAPSNVSSPAKQMKKEAEDFQIRQRRAAETLQRHRDSRSK